MSRRPNRIAAAAQLRHHAPVFAALGDETRLTLLSRLSNVPRSSISQLSEGSTITRQAITKHLRVLEAAGLVRAEAIGRERLYQLEAKALHDANRYLSEISKQWDDALGRLKAFVERQG